MKTKKIASSILSVSCRVLVFVLVAMTFIFLAREAYEFGRAIFVEQPMATGSKVVEVTVQIPEDYSKREVAEDFYNRGLVADKNVFYLQIVLSDHKSLTPGIYVLNTGMKPSEMLAVISVPVEEETTAAKPQATKAEEKTTEHESTSSVETTSAGE